MPRFLVPAVSASLCASLILGMAQAPDVQAHAGASGVVKERMEMMKALGGEMKKLAAMFKGEVPYDPSAVAAAANWIEDHSGGRLLRLFPEGSNDDPSEATQEVWRHWPDFEAKADDLGTEAAALAAAADAGKGEAKAAFGTLAGACKACHLDFKKD